LIYKISDKDKKDWENFLSSNEDLPNKDEQLIKKKIKASNTYDLHGYTLESANKKIQDLIHNSYEKGVKKLIIITGKGLHSENKKNPYVSKDFGLLRYSVPEYIKKDRELMKMIVDIQDAEHQDGGKGAFYIYLKKKL
tara:strand:- start:47 stop:460 length:414 start_codon:yes stop_codon:yes gene_type:complete